MKTTSYFLGLLLAAVSATPIIAQQTHQTVQQIQEQKKLADQATVEGAPDRFKTPLRTFEKYFGGICRLDASEFACLTRRAIKEWFGKEELTPSGLLSIAHGHQTRDERDHVLVEFRYASNAQRPKITFGYRYSFRFNDGERIVTVERERLTFVRTAEGWKIDAVESDPES